MKQKVVASLEIEIRKTRILAFSGFWCDQISCKDEMMMKLIDEYGFGFLWILYFASRWS